MAKTIDEQVLDAWLSFQSRGLKTALVTLVNVDGSAPRPVGSQIAVAESGETFGYITGGCAEAALAAEAIDAMARGESRVCRYGEGSRYVDVTLPCGAGIDVHFAVDLCEKAINRVVDDLASRRAGELALDLATADIWPGVAESVRSSGVYRRCYEPSTRLEIIGKGPVAAALARAANGAGMQVAVTSPEAETLGQVRDFADISLRVTKPESYDAKALDEWTAAAVLFHEHDWDPPVLRALIDSKCYYIGALGSRKTHAARIEALRQMGVAEEAISMINGPIGIDIHARSPEEIAISILAEVIEARRGNRAGPRWKR